MSLILGIAIAGALVIALAIGIWCGPLGRYFELLDFPDSDGGRKRHERITPMVGGSAVVFSTLLATAAVLLLEPGLGPSLTMHLHWFGGSVLALYLIGLADDRFELSAVIRLLLAMLMLALVVLLAPDFSLSFLRFGGESSIILLGGWGVPFVLLCLVGLLNAVNMADGKDGVVLSMALVWTVVLAFRLPAVFAPILAATGIALAVMWWFNMKKRLFLGDSGSYAISSMFGLLAIYAYNHDFAVMRADDVAVMFAIPVFDTIRLMVARKLAGRSMFKPDRDHLHHHLHANFPWKQGLAIYIAMVFFPNIGALALPGTGLYWLFVSLVMYVGVMWKTRIVVPTLAE